MAIGLLVGRFQPFHLGHLHAVRYCLSKSDELIIVIGSALESHTSRNPFTTRERIQMIFLALNESGISREKYIIIPVPDVRLSYLWVPLVELLTPPFDIVFSNDPLTRRLFIERGYRVEAIPFFKREIFSGNEFRKRVLKGENWLELVPKSVAVFLEKNNLLNRLIELNKR